MTRTLGAVLTGAFQQTRKPDAAPVVPDAPAPHAVVNTNLYPAAHVVVLETKDSPLAVGTHVTVLSWDIVEGLFLGMLQFRLRERGMLIGMGAIETPPPPKE